eukprot:CAMPEP_0198526584 /NCGR_PEP_ID=MMETSP1462-20131121/24046_1 /TAXON_ID=1333877 /ORGANISM="Brandtodinium nutriculum, Strain RCC3387" /LENGTH=134 /DNA_ID=CAMNT_0044256367 /DNA_START=52 /DNA_END=456 /DNA_ORIENTATION=+
MAPHTFRKKAPARLGAPGRAQAAALAAYARPRVQIETWPSGEYHTSSSAPLATRSNSKLPHTQPPAAEGRKQTWRSARLGRDIAATRRTSHASTENTFTELPCASTQLPKKSWGCSICPGNMGNSRPYASPRWR